GPAARQRARRGERRRAARSPLTPALPSRAPASGLPRAAPPAPPPRRRASTGGAYESRAKAPPLGRQPALDFGPVAGEGRLARRLEPEHQHGLRVRGAEQPPPFGEADAHAVQ